MLCVRLLSLLGWSARYGRLRVVRKGSVVGCSGTQVRVMQLGDLLVGLGRRRL